MGMRVMSRQKSLVLHAKRQAHAFSNNCVGFGKFFSRTPIKVFKSSFVEWKTLLWQMFEFTS